MSKYAQWMFTMQSVAVVFGYLIVWLSLRPTPFRCTFIAGLYSLLAIGLGALSVFPLFFGIFMANAFGPRHVSPMAYISPCIIAAFFVIPAFALFPFVPLRSARRIGFVVFAVILPLMLALGVVSIQAGSSPDRGLLGC